MWEIKECIFPTRVEHETTNNITQVTYMTYKNNIL